MASQSHDRRNWERAEQTFPQSRQRLARQQFGGEQLSEYNRIETSYPSDLTASELAREEYEADIRGPQPARLSSGRIPRAGSRFENDHWDSHYQALPTNDTTHILPTSHVTPRQPSFYAHPPEHSNAPGERNIYASSLAPSTNDASAIDTASAVNNDSTIPLVAPQAQQNFPPHTYQVPNPVNSRDDPYILDADTFLNRTATKLQVKRWLYWLDPKFFHEQAWFSWTGPHSYQLPGQYYKPYSKGVINVYRHRDVFRRKLLGLNDDRFLDPLDGRARKLFVQTTAELYDGDNDTTWRRTYVDNVSPRIIRLAYWPYSHMPSPNRDFLGEYGVDASSAFAVGTWKREQWTHVGLRWLPACIGLLFLMCGPTDIGGQVRNHGKYDPVPYRYWEYPLSARNFRENMGERPNSRYVGPNRDFRIADRCLRPRLLCFLDSRTEDNPRGCLDPQTWIHRHGLGTEPTYIFISYTAEKQFERRCPAARKAIQTKGLASYCDCKFCPLLSSGMSTDVLVGALCKTSASDAEALHRIARAAARKAKVAAYWTDQCCMSTDKDELQDDVYRISDVVRGAAKIVVVLGRTGRDQLPPADTTFGLLCEWGARMWTWPEVLLGPAGEKIQVYTRGVPEMMEVSKLEFPAQIWDDGEVARQLVDHYDNTLALSRLELVVLALDSLKRRVNKGTTKYLDGDLSYALMGLLRQRPKVVPADSAFQAFARLSLANDSDRLLERMICLLPTDESRTECAADVSTAGKADDRHYWTNMDDYWGAKLWDVEPACQVAGIGKDDTVILDGAYAATVHWDKFRRVAITTRETWSRMLARGFVRGTPGWFFIGVLTLALSAGNPSAKGVGAVFLIIALVTVFLSPMLILHIYGGKLWNTQPWLFGFEGHMSLRKIEMKIFGFPSNRLSWAPYASNMSHHRVNSEFLDAECEGTDPLLAAETENPGWSSTGEKLRVFTLVDTNTMTVTTFRAVRPPVVALLCGSEGGMQRAVMCSYDWANQCLWRETVLRMETMVLQKMPRVGRVRFGLRRLEAETGKSYLRPPA